MIEPEGADRRSREDGTAPRDGDPFERIREDAHVTRRDYLRILVTVSGGLLAGSAAVAAGIFPRHGVAEGSPVRIAGALEPGESRYFTYPTDRDPAIAVRLPGGALVAYSSVCTHLACGVLWEAAEERLVCPCHDGAFDAASGDVLFGPPPRPLPRVLLEERDDGIYAVGTA